jgi:hypothetical protein
MEAESGPQRGHGHARWFKHNTQQQESQTHPCFGGPSFPSPSGFGLTIATVPSTSDRGASPPSVRDGESSPLECRRDRMQTTTR